MSTVPAKAQDRLVYYENHIDPFTSHAVAIGTSPTSVADLATKTAAARDALTAKTVAEQAAKTATNAWQNAVNAMSLAGSAIIDQIRAKAKIAGPTIWDLAEVAPPAPPTPVGDLGKPSDFNVTLEETGELNLSWRCSNPRAATGTFYTVWRRIGNVGEFSCLGGCGAEKKFLDSTVPAGSASVTYKIQATRSNALGPWAQFVVNFGVDMGETTIKSVVETPAAKIAA